MLSGSQVGYARMTRRWMAPIRAEMDAQGISERPIYFVSSNTHALANLLGGNVRRHQARVGIDHLGEKVALRRCHRAYSS